MFLHPTMAKSSTSRNEFKECSADRIITRDEYSIFDYPDGASTIFSLVFEYLIFFDFDGLENVSKEFRELTETYIKHKYLNIKKRDLFKKFNLEYFLLNIDQKANTNVLAKPKPITFKEFKFILKFFDWEIMSVTLQTEYLSELHKNKDSDSNIQDVLSIIKEFNNKCNIEFININGREYATNILFNKSPDINIQRELSLTEFRSLILSGEKVLRALKLITDYSEINRNALLTEYLEHIEIGELNIKGASDSLNQCCDEILEALAAKNSNSFKVIRIESCHSYKLFTLLSKFKNLEGVLFDNFNYVGPHLTSEIDLSMIRELMIINCSIIDDWACYEMATNYFKNLERYIISNCENVSGSFIYKLNPSNVLRIDLTHLSKEFAPKIDVEKIPNGIIYSEWLYNPYSEEQIHNALEPYNESNIDNYAFRELKKIPHGFGNLLKHFFQSGKSFHLDLQQLNSLNEICLELIVKLLSYILILSLNTHYPHIPNQSLNDFLKTLTIDELYISGYRYPDIADERSCCDQIMNALLIRNIEKLWKIDITDCLLGEPFFQAIQRLKKLETLILNNIRVWSAFSLEGVHLSMVREISITNCPELNDEMCSVLIRNCVKLRDFYLSSCNNVSGSFLLSIDENRKISIHIADAPTFLTFFKDISGIPKLSKNITLYLCLAQMTNPCVTDTENYDLSISREEISNVIIFNDKLFTNLLKFRGISELTLSTFYPNINDWTNLCHLKLSSLYLFNNKFHENDATIDILNGFAELNSNCLKFLILKMCKINEHGIESIASLPNLEFTSFETMRGLTNDLLRKLSVPHLGTLEIIDNDELDDDTCFKMIEKLRLWTVSVVKCRKLSENLIKRINTMESIFLRRFNISGTDPGYYQLWNPLFFINPQKELLNFTHGTHVDYLKRIFGDTSIGSITKLPVSLIDCFSSQATLDLRDWYELDDVMFELISQLDKLGTLKIRTNYLHVMDRRAICHNLAKMNLHTLILQGYDKLSNCDDILEPFSYITNHLQEIHLINCQTSKELSESLCHTNKFSVYRISNEKTILHR